MKAIRLIAIFVILVLLYPGRISQAAMEVYSISGTVRDGGGNPVANVTMFAKLIVNKIYLPVIFKPGTGNKLADSLSLELMKISAITEYSTKTDSSGNYLFSNISPGTYEVSAWQDGRIFSPSFATVIVPTGAASQDFTSQDPTGMVFVPAGTFLMGCDPAHNGGFSCESDEVPLNTVNLKAYYIDQYELTNTKYAQCVAASACAEPSSNSSSTQTIYYNSPTFANYPVINVNWYQASDYCQWVGKRLPTEAEWEKTARGATDILAYPWGFGTPNCELANSRNDATNNYCLGDTSQVGSSPTGASPYGAQDIAGNVFEWINDWYQWNYYSISPTSNPPGPLNGTYKVLRGGSWRNYWNLLRVANRDYDYPNSTNNFTGFRCARSVGYSISGSVKDSEGKPVENAVIFAENVVGNKLRQEVLKTSNESMLLSINNQYFDLGSLEEATVYSTTTGRKGNYTIGGLAAGNYKLHAWQDGRIFSPVLREVPVPPDATSQNFTRQDPVDMIFVPGGIFQMGCDSTHNGGFPCSTNELPLHTVNLNGYYIDKFEVTNEKYHQCAATGACAAPSKESSYTHPDYYYNVAFTYYPVIWVDWTRANNYCNWAGKRLPTEAEWEKAARGVADTRTYPWSDGTPNCTLANYRNVGVGYCMGDTSQVGSYPAGASPYGALDMAGNVWEWVNDWYGSDYYCHGPSAITQEPWSFCGIAPPYLSLWLNPTGPANGTYKVYRGGSWNYLWEGLRVAFRFSKYQTFNDNNIGFRCAVSSGN